MKHNHKKKIHRHLKMSSFKDLTDLELYQALFENKVIKLSKQERNGLEKRYSNWLKKKDNQQFQLAISRGPENTFELKEPFELKESFEPSAVFRTKGKFCWFAEFFIDLRLSQSKRFNK
jgi:hypothetical protein